MEYLYLLPITNKVTNQKNIINVNSAKILINVSEVKSFLFMLLLPVHIKLFPTVFTPIEISPERTVILHGQLTGFDQLKEIDAIAADYLSRYHLFT